MSETLKGIYFEPSNPGSFAGINPLFTAAKQLQPDIQIEEVQEWLKTVPTYTLHKGVRRCFSRNRVIAPRINACFECDLADLSMHAKQNSGYKFLLIAIDVLSKKLYVSALKSKSNQNVVLGFEAIFANVIPEAIRTDAGKEFLGETTQELFKKNEIKHFIARNEVKAACAERVIRTLKGRIYKYMTANNTRTYLPRLADFVDAYNKSYHRSIKMRPIDVTSDTQALAFKQLYGTNDIESLYAARTTAKITVGDQVRLGKPPAVFAKSYLPTNTEEIFKVTSTNTTQATPLHSIEDEEGEAIVGEFYEKELNHVKESREREYRVENLLEYRGSGKQRKVLVKWLHYPAKFNSWILVSELKNISKDV